MSRPFAAVISALLLTFAMQETAAQVLTGYTLFGEDMSGMKAYYNPTRISRLSNSQLRVWTIMTRSEPIKVDDKGYHADEILQLLDCKEMRIKMLQRHLFENSDGSGETRSLPIATGWEYVRPNSLADLLLTTLCSRSK